VNRREFLKLAGAAVAGVIVSKFLPSPTPSIAKEVPQLEKPSPFRAAPITWHSMVPGQKYSVAFTWEAGEVTGAYLDGKRVPLGYYDGLVAIRDDGQGSLYFWYTKGEHADEIDGTILTLNRDRSVKMWDGTVLVPARVSDHEQFGDGEWHYFDQVETPGSTHIAVDGRWIGPEPYPSPNPPEDAEFYAGEEDFYCTPLDSWRTIVDMGETV